MTLLGRAWGEGESVGGGGEGVGGGREGVLGGVSTWLYFIEPAFFSDFC